MAFAKQPVSGRFSALSGSALASLASIALAASPAAACPQSNPASGSPSSPVASDGCLQTALHAIEQVPADVAAWLRLRDGAGLLDQPEIRALAIKALSTLGPGGPVERWQALAKRLDWQPDEAFLRLWGRDVRLILRTPRGGGDREDRAGESLDWAILSRVRASDVDRLMKQLRPVLRPGGRCEVPEEHVVFLYREGWLLAAPLTGSGLFDELAAHLPGPAPRSLRAAVEPVGFAALAQRRLVGVIATPGAFAGTTLFGADVSGTHLRCDLRGLYDRAPLRGLRQSRLDISLLARFDDAIAVAIEPIRPAADPNDDDGDFLDLFPELAPPAAFRHNLRDCRIVALGDVDGSSVDPPLRMRCPTIAIAFQIDDAAQGREDQDHLMLTSLRGLRARSGIAAACEPPCTAGPGPRQAPVGPVLTAAVGDHPILRGCSLNWHTIEAGGEAWQIYASHPRWLAEVERMLARTSGKDEATAPRDSAVLASAGRLCGRRLSAHLRSWLGEAERFAGLGADRFGDGVELLSSIVGSFGTVAWRIATPSEARLDVQIDAELAPLESAPFR